MTKINIIRLEPMRVASAYGFGANPEEIAWQKLVQWAKPKGFLENLVSHPVFGFNNPYPTKNTPRYGYEFWMKVDKEIEPEGDIRIYEFFGGLYAVTRCEAQGHPEQNIPEGWKSLSTWCKDKNHPLGPHPALERFLTRPDDPMNLVMDLCCPILS